MRITLTSVMVNDQTKALDFYTRILGFVPKTDIPLGEHRWLTVVSPEAPDGVELLLEPLGFAPARDYQRQLVAAGIPLTMFAVADIDAEVARLTALGVAFQGPPSAPGAGPRIATFDDTCGNLIRIYQP